MTDSLTQDPASSDATPVSTSTPSTLPEPSEPPPVPKPKPSKPKKDRRAPGEGSVYTRKSDGKWCATWTETLANGMKRKRVVYGTSKRDAIDNRTEAMKEVETQAENATKETVGLFMRRWLESHSSKLRPTSRVKYADAIRLYIAPEKDTGRGRGIGWILLSKLSPLDIETWIAAMEKLGIPPSRRREVCVTLNSALHRAVAWRLLKSNPMDGIALPVAKKPQMQVWDGSEVRAFLKACEGERLEALFYLALDTGMRQGELLGLQWESVETKVEADQANGAGRYSGRVHVRHNQQEVKGHHMPLSEPKTRSGFRTVTLTEETIRALIRHKQRMMTEGKAGHPYVFPSLAGTPLRKGSLSDVFVRISKRAGVKRIRFHDLRHTNATLLIGKGMDPKTVSSRLGHSSIMITLDTYAKFMPEADQRAAGIMADVFKTG
jgi:integrase